MTTAYSTNLGLALPVEGELSGTWGDTVNNGITQYSDIAIAGTLTLNGDGAVTLANTNGNSSGTNITSTTAQYAILKITGTTTTKVITAPSSSKTYTVINASSYAVTVKASGQTGVSIPAGDKAFIAFNGTDYVRVGASAGGSDTQVQYNSSGNLAGSANLTFDGTKLTVAGLKDSALTSGRVTYATTSGELTDSANFTFNGTTATINTLNLTTALGVAYGGTGTTSLTANNVILGNGTSAVQVVAPSTSGNVLTSNGTTWVSQAPAASGISQAKATAIAMVFGF